MSKKKKRNFNQKNHQFIDSALLNDATFNDYYNRFKKIALSIFEWVNLPNSMNAQYLERSLFYDGMASILFDKKYGFINTKCAHNGNVNIYGFPTKLNCNSYSYQENRILYTRTRKFR